MKHLPPGGGVFSICHGSVLFSGTSQAANLNNRSSLNRISDDVLNERQEIKKKKTARLTHTEMVLFIG